MTAAFLQSELASLIQDSKRRQSDVRTAAEKVLADLKAIQVTSETQLAGDLLRRPHFIEPFVLACSSKYVKLAVTGTICLQRLAASRAIAPSRLVDVLDAFQEASHQGLDVQLKILQALPSLLQLYAGELKGDALAKVLSLCASLAGSKTPLVSSTAIATFQQLITTLFEKRSQSRIHDDNQDHELEDAACVFNDMCVVVSGEQPQFLKSQNFPTALALEVIELSLSNAELAVLDIASCSESCKTSLVPGIIRILERSTSFSTFGQSLRTLHLLTRYEEGKLLDSVSEAFSTVLAIMDRPSGPTWRRLLCLEFMRTIISDFQLLKTIFTIFDCSKNHKGVVGALMSILVRIAAEDPALIGLGRQSTIPTNSDGDGAVTGGAVDVDVVGSVLQAGSNVTGISSRWSTLSSPLLEQLERPSAPEIPETYVYTVVLGCVASLSDGLSKFVMPLSVPSRATFDSVEVGETDGVPARKNSQVRRAEKYQRLLNPLKRGDLASKDEIEVCAKMIEDCWPAVLATCSTFLNSALDSYFYHVLVRTVQKLAQVSGVMELFTPRDALLTTLAKVSVPINASSMVMAFHGNKPARVSKEDDDGVGDDVSIKSAVPTTPRLSVDVSRQPLNVRNLLCLRALLNLGIALGPTLSEASWFIIIQALQQADALMSVSPATRNLSKPQMHDEADEEQTNLGSEITAVGTASKRMLESTRTYSDETFEVFLRSVFKMVDSLVSEVSQDRISKAPNGQQELTVNVPKHRASRSVSSAFSTPAVLCVEAEFVLKTVNDLARVNLHRFCAIGSQTSSWDIVAGKLLAIVVSNEINPQLRLQAASIIDAISLETARSVEKQDHDPNDLDKLQSLCLAVLAKQLNGLYRKSHAPSVLPTDVDIHRRLLEALENIISHSGESLTSGWQLVSEILQKTTTHATNPDSTEKASPSTDREFVLERTIPPAFRTVQLIVSDFLNTIDPQSFSILVELLPSFGFQMNDLNISLTTTVLFSNLSSLLLERATVVDIPISSEVRSNEAGTSAKQGANDVSTLWFATVFQLCRLCREERIEVRNSALRVLIRILESASPQLTTTTWNMCLQKALLPILKDYSSKNQETDSWQDSYNQLLQGVVGLFAQNVDAITAYADFSATWELLVSALDDKLSENSLDGHTVVFSAMTSLVQTLRSTIIGPETIIHPVLRSWSRNHPDQIVVTDKANQDALCAHAKLFSAISDSGTGKTKDSASVDLSIKNSAMLSIKQAALASIHPPYSSDVTKLSTEQVATIENIGIIKGMLISRKEEFAAFLIDLVNCIIERNATVDTDRPNTSAGPRGLKRPTLIAFMSHCLTIYRKVIEEEASSDNLLSHTSASTALPVLINIASSKYSNIPTSADLPIWQHATSTLTELVEAISKHATRPSTEDITEISQHIVQALEAILTAPNIKTKKPAPSPETIIKDEAFDIIHSARIHEASLRLLKSPAFPNHHRKQYIISLFHSSLIAKPWFGDLPPDLLNDPLSSLTSIRSGTIQPPDFPLRGKIYIEAFNALLGLVDIGNTTSPAEGSTSKTTEGGTITIARTAAPYVLLRIAHTMKVFLADQRLRHLIPPPIPLRRELNMVLSKAVGMRVVDAAFEGLLPTTSPSYNDGKTHLRILYPLVLKLTEFWVALPRLKVCAWQDEEDGKGVETALKRWAEALSEGWHIA